MSVYAGSPLYVSTFDQNLFSSRVLNSLEQIFAGSGYSGLTEKQVDFLCSRFYHKHKCLFLCYLSVLSSTSQKSRKSVLPLSRPSGPGLPLVHETVQRIPARAGKEVTFPPASVTAGAVNFSRSRALVARVRLTFSVSVLISLLR